MEPVIDSREILALVPHIPEDFVTLALDLFDGYTNVRKTDQGMIHCVAAWVNLALTNQHPQLLRVIAPYIHAINSDIDDVEKFIEDMTTISSRLNTDVDIVKILEQIDVAYDQVRRHHNLLE